MIETRDLMGMPITVEIVDDNATRAIAEVFELFAQIDAVFSTYKPDSEISKINRGEVTVADFSTLMQEVFVLAEKTKQDTRGFFDIQRNGLFDPSGLVKGWAIRKAAALLDAHNLANFYIEAGGDIETRGHNVEGNEWRVGIRNPFSNDEIIKVLELSGKGIATSGSYIRGEHIYNPHDLDERITDVVSVSVVAENVFEADRFATAAFAMGKRGIGFLEETAGLEGYVVDASGMATETSGFGKYVATAVS